MALKAIKEREYRMLLFRLSRMPDGDQHRENLERKLEQVKSSYDRLIADLGTTIQEYDQLSARIRCRHQAGSSRDNKRLLTGVNTEAIVAL